jgi:hypothetical protein
MKKVKTEKPRDVPGVEAVRGRLSVITAGDWRALKHEMGEDPVGLDDLRQCDFRTLPRRVSFFVLDDNFPETVIKREGDNLICEIAEHIYSKYWWHKFSSRSFADAMEGAVKRLIHEGHPFRKASIESEDDVHIWIRWQLILPVATAADAVIEAINSVFDLVWQRANAMLEDSDSVLVLGKDTGAALKTLKRIASKLQAMGYHTYIIKEQPDRLGESIVQKVLRYALSSKFVIIENSQPSGHLYEVPHVAKLAECVTAVLQERGKGATWMFEDAYAKHPHWQKIVYAPTRLEKAVEDAARWAEKFRGHFAKYQMSHLPWLADHG